MHEIKMHEATRTERADVFAPWTLSDRGVVESVDYDEDEPSFAAELAEDTRG
ncbi:hypothetical protein ABZX92_44480 [Lentzea sp. NPDC006480]|uniref:hypothetical protein n=1 Tax=Lentzea sp. NPDC006480 TaxID=3157176 RepID=UPI0033B007D5